MVAAALASAWRAHPSEAAFAPRDLAHIVPLLIGSGAGALAWHRVSRSAGLKDAPECAPLRDAYRHQALQSAIKEAALGWLAERFAAAGLEPMLFKGWAVARHYSALHLRPFGDFDLAVPAARHADAAALLAQHAIPGMESPRHGLSHDLGNFAVDCAGTVCMVDLHRSLDKFRLPIDAVYERSRSVAIGETAIRVPGPEDHLRLVVLHFLAHGGWRPLWLTDIAALLETLPDNFDWPLCVGADVRVSRWITCAIALAHRLLGARVEHVPAPYLTDDLPPWLARTVLKEWQAPFAARHVANPLAHALANPRIVPAEFRARWPNGIRATVERDGRFDTAPRLPYQLASFARWATRRLSGSAA